MLIFKKSYFIIFLLIFFLMLPSLVIILTPSVYSADSSGEQKDSWLKGILLIILSYVVNNFVQKNNENENPQIGYKPAIDSGGQNGEREVLAFYVNWLSPEASSYQSLKENWRDINMMAPFWYTVNPDGSIESRYGGHQYEAYSYAKNRNIKVLPLINNSQQNNMMLVDPEIRTKAINNIVDMVEKYNYNGVNIDFELIPQWTRNSYTAFIKELSQKLKRNDKMTTISVFPKIDVPINLQGAYDYAALAPHVDRLVIMTYDNHWSTGPAGPIAPISWVEKNIKYALEYLPAEKILLGIANYGYDWTSYGQGQSISAKKALEIASNKNIKVKWHQIYQVPYYYYWDEKGNKHEVWFESSNSAAFKFDLVNKYNLKGIAIWRLGNGTEQFWKMIKQKLR